MIAAFGERYALYIIELVTNSTNKQRTFSENTTVKGRKEERKEGRKEGRRQEEDK